MANTHMADTYVKCDFCGHTYRPEESRSQCGSCPLHPGGKSCGWLRCPNCGYEVPREPAWLLRLRRLLSRGARKPVPCAEDHNGHAHRLSELPEGYRGRVASLVAKDQRKLQKLLAFGILPGMPVRVLQVSPAYVFQVGQTQLAVDKGIADDILIGAE